MCYLTPASGDTLRDLLTWCCLCDYINNVNYLDFFQDCERFNVFVPCFDTGTYWDNISKNLHLTHQSRKKKHMNIAQPTCPLHAQWAVTVAFLWSMNHESFFPTTTCSNNPGDICRESHVIYWSPVGGNTAPRFMLFCVGRGLWLVSPCHMVEFLLDSVGAHCMCVITLM